MSRTAATLGWALLSVFVLAAAMLTFTLPASSQANDQTCPQEYEPFGGEKVEVQGNKDTVTVTAPDGFLITKYCVKAGSANQPDGGPVIKDVDPPMKTVTITHPTGKDISHYTVKYVPVDNGGEAPGNGANGEDGEDGEEPSNGEDGENSENGDEKPKPAPQPETKPGHAAVTG